MQNFIVLRCLVTEEIAEQIKSEPRTQNPEHTQAALYNKGLDHESSVHFMLISIKFRQKISFLI